MNDLLKKPDPSKLTGISSNHSDENVARQIAPLERALYVLLFALLVAIRIPTILEGRMWAEEGRVFFENAWNFPWQKALWISYGGYLNISANLASVMARHWVPLEKACYVTSGFGLLIQTFPAILLCMSHQKWLQNRKTLLAALLIIATLPLSQEVWLSSIGSQCHLNLCVALILTLEPLEGLGGIFQKFVLLLAPLSGPGAGLLLPLYALRTWVDKSKPRLIQTLLLSAGTIIQFAFFFRPGDRLTLGPTTTEAFGIDPILLLNVFYVKHLLGPFLGFNFTCDLAKGWGDTFAAGQALPLQGTVIALVYLAIFSLAIYSCNRVQAKWLFLSGTLLFAVANFGALGFRAALLNVTDCERYVFAPQVLFELSILAFAFSASGWKKNISVSVITWLLIIAAHEYFWTPPFFRDGPIWRKEVHEWRTDAAHKLKIWPSGWSVTLKPTPQNQVLK